MSKRLSGKVHTRSHGSKTLATAVVACGALAGLLVYPGAAHAEPKRHVVVEESDDPAAGEERVVRVEGSDGTERIVTITNLDKPDEDAVRDYIAGTSREKERILLDLEEAKEADDAALIRKLERDLEAENDRIARIRKQLSKPHQGLVAGGGVLVAFGIVGMIAGLGMAIAGAPCNNVLCSHGQDEQLQWAALGVGLNGALMVGAGAPLIHIGNKIRAPLDDETTLAPPVRYGVERGVALTFTF